MNLATSLCFDANSIDEEAPLTACLENRCGWTEAAESAQKSGSSSNEALPPPENSQLG